jgi:NADH dehydrogenase [ubiquinone] 1 alpha subcomplex assembly factor 7
MIGAWCAIAWRQAGAPGRIRLVELGPGRGTLMADALRAAAVLPAFGAAAEVHLVETGPVLREVQRGALAAAGRDVAWHERLDQVPAGPLILLANEFFDALPVHQFQRRDGRWHERCVAPGAGGGLEFRLSPDPAPVGTVPEEFRTAAEGAVFERSPDRERLAGELGARLATGGGAALIVDYGPARSGLGDTFQAVRAHRFADPLDAPGEADLTSHVDFAALALAGRAGGADAHGPVGMGTFLTGLGMAVRARALKADKPPDVVAGIDAAFTRLTAPDQMGSLFKVLALTAPGLAAPPPFAEPPVAEVRARVP